ncbi:transposase [Streptomyces sp. NPDC056910]|uniref:transposase n=1 Tax=Streptomyces sp. NPDC056910 TaxID=3345964 RepID=UPI0036CD303F
MVLTCRTVKLLADATTPEDLFHGQWQGRPSVLDEYGPTWTTAGTRGAPTHGRHGRRSCHSATKAATSEFAPTSAPNAFRSTRAPHPRPVAGWILRHPDSLCEFEQLRLKAVLTHCPELETLTGHVHSFAQILTERQGQRLPEWLDAVRQDDLPGLHTLAAGIDRDRAAVIAGLTLPGNSGVVEGHVNRIKMLKRQTFGRAGFALLRKRVLLAP